MITQGKCEAVLAEHGKWFHGIRNTGGYLCFSRNPQRYPDQQERYEAEIQENKDNAALIAEAFNVCNETGFTPRQLADQKAGLLAACKNAYDIMQRSGAFVAGSPIFIQIEQATAKAGKVDENV